MKLPVALNRNTVLLILGWACTQGPDIDAAAAWLKASHVPHAMGLVHLLGGLSLTLGALALAMPWIRQSMAALGLATPPGAKAPWTPDAAAPKAETSSTSAITTVEKIDPKKSI